MRKLTLFALLLFLCTHSWGACGTGTTGYNLGSQYCGTSGTLPRCCSLNDFDCQSTYYQLVNGAFPRYYIYSSKSYYCPNPEPYQATFTKSCYYSGWCDTQAEADSAYCALNPTAEGCQTETDTTLFACSWYDSGNNLVVNTISQSAIYRLSCKAVNGVVTSCNDKTGNVNFQTDGTPVRVMQGTCAQNGFGTGIIGGATGDTTQPQSANADCFAVIGSTCHMKDRASGNTFRCECDGSCNVALRNLMAGNASCTNPYEQPQQGDSLDLPLSSGSDSPSSSGSGEGSSPSSSPSGEGNSSDFEYDYTEILQAIQANTQQTATELGRSNEFLNNIQNNTETANSFLQAIANKDWNPTINVAAPNVNVAGDTNIINVEVTGDTAHAGAEINQYLRDTSGIGGYAEQFETDKAKWGALADSVKAVASAFVAGVDSATNDTSWAKHGTDVDSAVRATGSTFRAYMDTIQNSPFNDTLNRWVGMITNNGTISGNGSNNCPSLLTRHHTLTIGNVSVDVGSLGGSLCEPVVGGVTLWAMARMLLRAIVAIGCMMWIYAEVVGVNTTGEDD